MKTESIYRSPEGEQAIMAIYDEVLARWPAPREELYLTTRHGRTFVIASGDRDARPLVLLHGAASNSSSWVGDMAALCASYRVYAVDLVGEAGKSDPNRPAWDGPGFDEWLEDVLDGLKVQKTAILGISQGGWTAIKFACAHPERVERLVLLTPGGIKPTRKSFIFSAIFFSMFGNLGANKINDMVIGGAYMHPLAIKYMDVIMANFKCRIEKEYIFTDEELKRLTMPILLVGGARDSLFPTRDISARMKKLLPQTQMVMLADKGHALVDVMDHVLPFLNSTSV